MLSFPGLFAEGGLLGAGPQTTAWIYMFWHGGFPLLVIGYALLPQPAEDNERPARLARAHPDQQRDRAHCGLRDRRPDDDGQALLPPIMDGSRYTVGHENRGGHRSWLLSLAALGPAVAAQARIRCSICG